MTLPSIIDVAIGLVLMFFILASLGSILAEFVVAHQKLRHKLLFSTVTRLLEPATTKKFWRHPLILPLYSRTPPGERKKTTAPIIAAGAKKAADTTPTAAKVPPKQPWAVVRLWRGLLRKFPSLKVQTAEAPAYLEGKLFASVVLDLATGEGAVGRVPSTTAAWEFTIRKYIPCVPGENNDLQDRLLALLRQVPPDTADCGAALKAAVAKWYDESMTRASGEYRRQLQKCLFFIGCGLAVFFNCDALRIATVLYQSPTLRAQVAQQAETLVQEKTPAAGQPATTATPDNAVNTELKAQLKENIRQLRDLTKIGFPIGWSPVWRDNFILKPEPAKKQDDAAKASPAASAEPPPAPASSWFPAWPGKLLGFIGTTITVAIEPGFTSWMAKIAGLFATAFAVCLGAPFWFDLLGRLVKMRSSAGSEAEKKKADEPGAATSNGTVAVAATSGAVTKTRSIPDALTTLSDPSMAFSLARAYWLAEIADQAYGLDPKDVTAWCRQQGFTNVQFFEDTATGTQAVLVEGPAVAVLAFRGTETKIDDWLTDAKCVFCEQADIYGSAKVHAGFHAALTALWKNQTLARSLSSLAGSRTLLHLTGHSLGGALATLAAYRLAKRNPQAVQSIYTYGSPRVGDPAFVREFDTLFAGRAYRVVNNEDLVTRVPPRSGGYDHIGTIIYIDDTGTIQRDIGFWYRFLNFAANAAQDFQQALKTTLHDHGLRLYCGHLEQAAKKSDRVS